MTKQDKRRNLSSSATSSHRRQTQNGLTSLDAEYQVCAKVLEHLATGTTPTDLQPPPPQGTNSLLNRNSTVEDQIAYETKSDAEHHKLLTAALSIMLDSTSPGPDPLALEFLGWAYGGGGGGGMGDWDGCHYMPGSIGQTLRVLQDQVALQLMNEYDKENINNTDYLSENKSWWLQNHEVEYGKGYERSATRFCTIGGVPPGAIPYNKDGMLWGPPLAGVCMPSSCTAEGLYMLFDVHDGFAESLVQMATRNGFYDDQIVSDNESPVNEIGVPTASRRFRYMSSLAQSFNAGRTSKMGIICEGESGLAELDQDGYTSTGYYVTVGLIWVLFTCVLLGTVTASWVLLRKKDENNDASKSQESDHNHKNLQTVPLNNDSSSVTYYGSNIDATEALNNHDKKLSFLDAIDLSSQSDMSDGYNLIRIDESEEEDNEFINLQERQGINLLRSNSSFRNRNSKSYFGTLLNYVTILMEKIPSTFSHFDAGQSFYEITRMKREDPYVDSQYQQRFRKSGETSLDPSNSTPGLFPMYKPLTPLRKGAINPDYSISVSSSNCLNGMRSLSMLWIIFGHTLAVQASVGYVNPAALLPPTGMMASPLGKFFLSARYAVDTFFFIGGFLVMSGLLKRLDPALNEVLSPEEESEISMWKNKMTRWGIINRKHVVIGEFVNRLRKHSSSESKQNLGRGLRWVVPFLLHRILRILPTYGIVLLLWWKIAATLGDGPFWPRWATFVAQCDSHAWTNMLFINNLVPRYQPFGETSECMYHAWYLGVDFQLCLILTPIFVTLYLRKGWRKTTMYLEALTLVTIIITSIFFSFKYNWSSHLWDGADTVAFDRGFYINPFFRSSPYIIGFITAQLWHEKCRLLPRVGVTKSVSIALSALSIMIMIYWTIFSIGSSNSRPCQTWETPRYESCGSGWSKSRLAALNSFARPAWGFGLAIMSLLAFNGQLTFLWSSTILNWAGWDPVSKLSFSMYLLHPLVINVWVLGGDDKFRYSIVDTFYAFAGIVTVTIVVAVIIGVLVEWPLSKITRDLEKKLWTPRKAKNDEWSHNGHRINTNGTLDDFEKFEKDSNHTGIKDESIRELDDSIRAGDDHDYRYGVDLDLISSRLKL